MMNTTNLFAPRKMENDVEEVEEVYELTFGQQEFDNILKNEYCTFTKVAYDTEEEWEYIMEENTQNEPEEEEDNDDEFESEDEILI